MNILLPFTNSIPGGIARVTLELITEFVRAGDSVVLIVPEDEVTYFRQNTPQNGLCHILGAFPASPSRASEIARAASQFECTHCLFPNPESMHLDICHAIERHLPIAVIVHDLEWNQYQAGGRSQSEMPQRLQLKSSLAEAELIFVPSTFTRNEILATFPTFSQKIKCIHHAYNTNLLSAEASLPVIIPESALTIYYPSSAYGSKNHLLLFKAAKLLAEQGFSFHIVLTGWNTELFCQQQLMDTEGAELARKFYQSNLAVLKERITFLGYCDYGVVEAMYAQCDLVVLPSLYEGFGLGLLESASRNAPVLCSDLVVFQEQIERYGLHTMVSRFQSNNLDDFVSKITSIAIGIKTRRGKLQSHTSAPIRTWHYVANDYRSALLALTTRGVG